MTILSVLICLLFSVSIHAQADFLICTNLAGEDDNNSEVNCVKTTDLNEARAILRERGIEKRKLEKLYSKKYYPREHATSFLPQE